MKKLVAILLTLAMAVTLLSACGSSAPAQETEAEKTEAEVVEQTTVDSQAEMEELAKYQLPAERAPKGEYFGDLITVAVSSGATSFDPMTRGGGFGIAVNTFEKLANVDSAGNFKLLMAKSITKVDDVTYDIELWDFITDTAGNNITAEDAKWSCDTWVAQGNEGAVAKLDNLEVTGKYTLTWHCKEPFTVGEYEKQLSNFSIFSQKAYEEDPDHMASNPIATGPYKLKEFMEGSYAIYEANEDYWYWNIEDDEWLIANDGIASYQNFKEIRADIISDASARAIALENGAVDACSQLNATDVANYVANPNMGLSPIDIPVNPPVAFYFNCAEGAPCSDINLRKAICYAIDSKGVAEGLDVPAYQVFGIQPRMYDAPANWTTGEGRDYYNYDPAKAKEYLDKSNYNGEELVVEFSDMDQRQPAWVLIQAQLKEVGINLSLHMVERATETPVNVFTGWDMKSDTFGGGSYVANTVKRWWSEEHANDLGGGMNVCGVVDEEFDKLYKAVLDDNTEENINAWDQCFTYDNCYGYAVCCFYTQTACKSEYNAALFGNQNQLAPGAFTLAK